MLRFLPLLPIVAGQLLNLQNWGRTGGLLGHFSQNPIGNQQNNGFLGLPIKWNPYRYLESKGWIPPPSTPSPNTSPFTSQRALLGDMRSLLFTGDPGQQRWKEHARMFCQMYPNHYRCLNGNLPQFNELESLLISVGEQVRKFAPMIPRLNIKNPLLGTPVDLSHLIETTIAKVGELEQQAIQNIKGVCQHMNCLGQKEAFNVRKKLVQTKLLEFEKSTFGKDTSEDLEIRMIRTRQVKQALIDKANLKGIVTPADDGVFDKDTLLTVDQANFLLNELGKGGTEEQIPLTPPGVSAQDHTHNVGKRASIFFEENYVKKWDITKPILYTFHESLVEWDKNDVRFALAEITENVPCIKFEYTETSPKTPHLHYVKIDNPSFCGLSYIGRSESGNPIYLSFSCGNAKGVAIHETMHALGVAHQHLRMDRDQWLSVDWSNVNPQHYDMFSVVDAKLFTSYGVPYDYKSIMHYNAYTGAVDISKPTMIPKQDRAENIRILGQRVKMSQRDIEILNKMYCKPNCWDTNVYCGTWALANYCHSTQSGRWMQQNCRKSCNFC